MNNLTKGCITGSGSASLMAAQQCTEAPQSELESQFATLDRRLTSLAEILSALENRLVPVLRPVGIGECTDKAAPEEMLSPAADQVRDAHKRVSYAIGRINTLLDTLAV